MANQYASLNFNEEKINNETHKSLKQLFKKLKYAKERYYMTHSRKNKEEMENIKLNIIMLRGIKSKYVNKNFLTYEMKKKKECKMNKERIKKEKKKREREIQLKEKQKYCYYQKERERNIIRHNNLKRIHREFRENKDLIREKFLCELQEIYEKTYIPQPICFYFYNWDIEKIYNMKIPEEYSWVGLRKIKKITYKLFDKLPLDIFKIIWKFYYDPNYLRTGFKIETFKKNIDKEKYIYNMKMKLYS